MELAGLAADDSIRTTNTSLQAGMGMFFIRIEQMMTDRTDGEVEKALSV